MLNGFNTVIAIPTCHAQEWLFRLTLHVPKSLYLQLLVVSVFTSTFYRYER